MGKFEEIRNEEIARILANISDPGRKGKAKELLRARKLSRKTTVSEQGKTDNHVAIRYDGKVHYVGVESKTNGGRIENILNGKQKEKFVIYSLEFTKKYKATKNSPAREEKIVIPDIIVPTALFRELLLELKCYKNIAHGGKVDGIGIQVSSKKFYNRLLAYVENYGESVLFDPNKIYDSWELEDLEI